MAINKTMNMEPMTLKLFTKLTLITTLIASTPAVADNEIFGEWLAENGKTRISTYPCVDDNKAVCSAITWLKNPRKDTNNVDPTLRTRDLIGVEVAKNMRPSGKNRWKGSVYSSKKGEIFPSTARLKGGILVIKGCLTKSRILCKTQTFSRFTKPI